MHIASKVCLGLGVAMLILGIAIPWGMSASLPESDLEVESYLIWNGTSAVEEPIELMGDHTYLVMLKNGTGSVDEVEVSVSGNALFDEFVVCSNESRQSGRCDTHDGYVAVGSVKHPTSCPCTLNITAPAGSEVVIVDQTALELAWGEALGGWAAIGIVGCCMLGGAVLLIIVGFILWAVLDDDSAVQMAPAGAVMGVAPTAPVQQTGFEQPVPVLPATAEITPVTADSAVTADALSGGAVDADVKSRDPEPADPARQYHDALLAQGFDAATAAAHAQQHFPGFQP